MNSVSGTHLAMVEDYFRSTVDFWDGVYEEDTLNGALYREREKKVLEFVAAAGQRADKSRVLEIGCGAGRTAVALARLGYSVDALDVVPQMLDHVRRRASSAGVSARLRTHVGDVNQLPFESETFDIVLAIGVLEWCPSLDSPLREMARVVRPGGHLVVNVDNALAFHCFTDPRLNPLIGRTKRAVRPALVRLGVLSREARPGRCSSWQLGRALRRAGLRTVRGVSCGFGPFTVFGRRVLSDPSGLRIHTTLQRWADQGVPIAGSGGETCLSLSVKAVPVKE